MFSFYPSFSKSVLFTYVNYVKVVQWLWYIRSEQIVSLSVSGIENMPMIWYDNDISGSNVFIQNWMLISLLMSNKKKNCKCEY